MNDSYTAEIVEHLAARLQECQGREGADKPGLALDPLAHALLDHLQDAMYVHLVDAAGQCSPILLVNQAACDQLGYTRAELLAMTIPQLEDPAVARATLPEALAQLQRAGSAVFYTTHRRKDGGPVPVEIAAQAVAVPQGLLILALARPRAEAERAIEALLLSENRCQTIIDRTPFGLLECEADARGQLVLISINRAAERMLGGSTEGLLGRPIDEIIQVLDEREWPRHLQAALIDQREYQSEALPCRVGQVFGTYEICIFSTAPGRVGLMLNDVTAREQARMSRNREGRTRQLLYRTITALNHCAGLEEALPTLLQAALDLTGMEMGAVYLLHGERAELTHHQGVPDELAAEMQQVAIQHDWIQLSEDFASTRNLLDAGASPRRDRLRAFGIHDAYSVRLRADGKIYGFLIVATRQQTPLDPSAIDTLPILAADTESLLNRLQREAALRMTQYSLEKATSTVYWIAPDGSILYSNTAGAEHIGRVRHEMTTLNVGEINPTITAEYWKEHWEELREKGAMSFQSTHRHADGSEIPVEVHANLITFEGKEFNFAFVHDLRERMEAERALAASEARYRTLVENLPGVVYRCEAAAPRRTLLVSDSAETLFGCNFDDTDAPSHFSLILPEDRAAVESALEQSLREHMPYSLEYRIRREDGRLRWLHDRGQAGCDEAGQPCWLDGVIFDVTSRKEAEEERRRLVAAIDQSSEVIVITDNKGDIQYVNPAFETVTGFSRLEALGNNPRVLRSGRHNQDFYRRLWSTILSGNSWRGQLVNRRKNGTLFSEEAVISPVRDEQGTITNFVAVKRDITKEQELQAQLRQAQKMEAVGKLAGGVAHDFNNLLQVITGYTELARNLLDANSSAHDPLQQVQVAGERAARLVSQLLAFSRRQIIQPEDLDLNEVIATLMKMMGRVIGEHINVAFIPGDNLGAVRADRGQVEQILMNLCVNARDAMPAGGQLKIGTSHASLTHAFAEQNPWARAGEFVRLEVSDRGLGMNAETLEHIFEPFFTTKDVGEGTGLGLATIYGIVQQHEGFIRVESHPGQGTTFEIYLPACAPSALRLPKRGTQGKQTGGNETILLAEDDDMVRRLARMLLEGAGYRVLVARDGLEAIELYREHGSEVDLLLLDVVMPRCSGREALSTILKLNPRVLVLFASGYSEATIHSSFVLEYGLQYIQKPYNPRELLDRVRDLLDRARHRHLAEESTDEDVDLDPRDETPTGPPIPA